MSKYTVRVWDADFNLIGNVTQGWRIDEPTTVAVPLDTAIGQAVASVHEASTYLTVDHPERERWCGQISQVECRYPFGTEPIAVAQFADNAPGLKIMEHIADLAKRVAEVTV